MRRLPWLLIGLAHYHESKARELYARAADSYDKDHDHSKHHRLTWFYLGSPLRVHLDSWLEGVPRDHLPAWVLERIA